MMGKIIWTSEMEHMRGDFERKVVKKSMVNLLFTFISSRLELLCFLEEKNYWK